MDGVSYSPEAISYDNLNGLLDGWKSMYGKGEYGLKISKRHFFNALLTYQLSLGGDKSLDIPLCA